jgi:hypothetical protein
LGYSFTFTSYFVFCYYFPLAKDLAAPYFLSLLGSLAAYFLSIAFESFLLSFSLGLGFSFLSAAFLSSLA